MIKKVIFHVGEAHPLYNKPVDAEIISENAGYNGKCIYAKTIKAVEFPEDPKGLLVFHNGKFTGFETKPAHSSMHEGYCVLA